MHILRGSITATARVARRRRMAELPPSITRNWLASALQGCAISPLVECRMASTLEAMAVGPGIRRWSLGASKNEDQHTSESPGDRDVEQMENEGPIVPESVLKKQKRSKEWALVKKQELESTKKKKADQRKLVYNKAKQYAKDYEQHQEKELIQLKREARLKGGFYKCGKLDEQIELLRHKLRMIYQGEAFNGKPTKTARSHGRKFQVTIKQETSRILMIPSQEIELRSF